MKSKEVRNHQLKKDQRWYEVCFTFISPWKEEGVNGRRRVWINVYGVSLHAWFPQMFRKTGNMIGKVVEIDNSTVSQNDLRTVES